MEVFSLLKRNRARQWLKWKEQNLLETVAVWKKETNIELGSILNTARICWDFQPASRMSQWIDNY